MTATAIKKQVDNYLPLLTIKQQELVLDMIKNLLHLDTEAKKITKKQYNKELKQASDRIEKGDLISHQDALNEISNW
jgi:hypothetical protein